MNFWQGFKYVHRESWAFLLACPLIALIPIAVEFVQHYVEMQAGMYTGTEGMRAAESDPGRMIAGYAKTLAISLIGYSVIRFLAGNRDAAAARTLEPRAVKLFAVIFVLQAGFSYLGLFVFEGMSTGALVLAVAGFIATPLLARFIAAAPLGIFISPQESAAQMWRQIPWAIAFSIIASLPLMIVHYALGVGAVFVPGEAIKWAMLAVDSLVVGWLAALVAASSWVVATRKDPPESLT
ncbi:hypothetical protein [Erythrobacter sp. HKB08]|uniref:hypothetical protein n=1 Tax=Erythrobacter sp. HKB08 TaxID=2502843 RepID=UPI001008ADE2|nr:hypothetical protein [Erythrobacter sp. HKB08]